MTAAIHADEPEVTCTHRNSKDVVCENNEIIKQY